MKGNALLQGEIIVKKQKYTKKFQKIFSRTTGPISIKLGTNHPWVKGIPVCSNEGADPLQRGDNYKNRMVSF
jgi:hypothetical protein